MFAAARDVTELKQFEHELQQKNVELEDASRMKSEFLANMSHELRTPLNAIIGFSEVLKDGMLGDLTEKQRGFIGDIFNSGTHLLSLINDILDLSKVEAGKMLLDLDPVELMPVFTNSLSIIREKAASRGVRLTTAGLDKLGTMQLDARKVKQILYNLLSNAVKFTGDRGEVSLRASRVPSEMVGKLSGDWAGRSFPLANDDFEEFLEISVRDSGIGMSPEGLERLFKPFSQVDSGLARKFEGTGLGLAMVKLLAELHGGSVAVESAVGEGSRFIVWLPIRSATDRRRPTPSMGVPAVADVATGPRVRTALVVEDDEKAAALIRMQLEAEGFRVLHAPSAEAAMEIAATQQLTLITLDLLLPKMGGWEFLEQLKTMPDQQRVPVVIVSVVADRDRGVALGASAVLEKPVSRDQLYTALVELRLLPVAENETLKVLIADDDSNAVELIAVRIDGLASTVLRAYGGKEAIEMARRELPDLLVLDLMMPDVSGFDVVVALNEHPETARIPIVVVTAAQLSPTERLRLTGYVTTIMEKSPFDNTRLMAEVRRAMMGRPIVN